MGSSWSRKYHNPWCAADPEATTKIIWLQYYWLCNQNSQWPVTECTSQALFFFYFYYYSSEDHGRDMIRYQKEIKRLSGLKKTLKQPTL